MHSLVVGQPYVAGRTSWPEGAEYNYLASGHELRIFFTRPSPREILAIRRGSVHLALFDEDGVLALVWRFDGIGAWSDCPYNYHLVPTSHRALPDEKEGEQRALLQVVLVDAASGIVRGLRALTLPAVATKRLHAAIRRQAALPFDRVEYDAALKRAYERYAHSQEMAAAAQVLVKGGL